MPAGHAPGLESISSQRISAHSPPQPDALGRASTPAGRVSIRRRARNSLQRPRAYGSRLRKFGAAGIWRLGSIDCARRHSPGDSGRARPRLSNSCASHRPQTLRRTGSWPVSILARPRSLSRRAAHRAHSSLLSEGSACCKITAAASARFCGRTRCFHAGHRRPSEFSLRSRLKAFLEPLAVDRRYCRVG